MNELVKRREEQYYGHMNQRLAESPYLGGPELTCEDIMSMFRLTTGTLFGARRITDLPNIVDYVKRIEARPTYQKAMAIAGPDAVAPKA